MSEPIKKVVDSYRNVEPVVTAEDRIRALDASAKGKAGRLALALGIAGALVLGVGMSLSMVPSGFFALGIVIGIAGIALAAAAYPLYLKQLSRERDSVRAEILELAGQLPA
ncbi:hypothetical protein PZH32_02285 [Adlercreutzia equolifaciens]|uniref:hypothetical protein n=1 Tax=Adlercreutzia equolifaciens TaxID=446660 RepID=UPI0023AFA91D|nr:hypothetical protein [Adlercreutzia equolifaciens]MDE8701787.1 hypothetical protein [Adlercreutzia equolifaciens]